jgi:hypothetical protein
MHKPSLLKYLCLPLLFFFICAYSSKPVYSAYFPITATPIGTVAVVTTPTLSVTPTATDSPVPLPSSTSVPSPSPSPSPIPSPSISPTATSITSPTPLSPTPAPSPVVYATPIIGAFRQHQGQAPQAPASANLLVSGSVGSATSPAPITLDGNNHTVTYQVPATITTILSSASQWALSITSTQFSTGGTNPSTLPTSASTISGAPSLSCLAIVGSCITPKNTITYPLVVPAASSAPAAVVYYSGSAPSGLVLTFTITPTINVYLPASTAPGTYTSTVTVVLSSGP